ncbi:MAG TPA: hypothetical protein PLK37_11780, partial [Terricaulis sp.]|nr:hypothetical protein [Terricaulis sp.]
MTDSKAADEGQPSAPAPKRRRAVKKAPPTAAAPKPAAAPAPAPAKPAPPPPAPLSMVAMEQTAESLAQLSANLTQAMTRANQVFSTAFLDQSQDASNWKPDPLGVQGALNDVWAHLVQQPETLRDAHAKLWARYAEIWQKHTAYMLTGQMAGDEPARDKRFKDPEWRSNPGFSLMRETYLATA